MRTPESRERADRTLRRLDDITEIPTLPPVLLQIWDLTAQSGTSAEQLARAMSGDPGLTGAILRLANSAYFGFPRKVATVKQAIVVLGFDTVRSLATGASVFRAFGRAESIDAEQFFRHCLITAMGARMLLQEQWPPLAGTGFCSGVLHDLGKLVMAEFLPDSAAELARVRADHDTLAAAEDAVLGLSHAEVGAWFAVKWNFPDELAAAIRWHHEPAGAEPEYRRFAAAVQVADVLAHRAGAGGPDEPDVPEVDPEALQILGISADSLEEWTNQVLALSSEAPSARATLGVEAA